MQNISRKNMRLAFFLALAVLASGTSHAQDRPAEAGVHKIWGTPSVDKMSIINGSYVVAEWKDINPSPGVYDFSHFDRELKRLKDHGQRATVAVRGRNKPDYLFKEIPYHPDRLALGVHDPKGSLQYWHPQYQKRLAQMLAAFAKHLRNSPYRSQVYSIRQNVNALGTEHSRIPEDKRAKSQWVIPSGVSFVPYSDSEDRNFKIRVSQEYYDLFSRDFLLQIRTDMLAGDTAKVPTSVLNAIAAGRVGLLHTSSTAEPETANRRDKYEVHMQYGKYGKTLVYAEPYGPSTRGPQPRTQWNYWRLLSDLHAGVTFISVYGEDLNRIDEPEYAAAFEFTNKYAGYHTEPALAKSPGAWVAMRKGGKYLTGDYTFLMTRMSGDSNVPLESVGSDKHRFGAWARQIPAGGRMRLQLDDRFANTLGSGKLVVKVTYFNSNSPKFSVQTKGARQDFSGGSSGTWKTVQMTVPASDVKGNSGADITLRAENKTIIHMVEVLRNGSTGAPPTVSQAPPKAPTALVVN